MKRYDGSRPVAVGVVDKQHAALAFAAHEARLAGCDLRVVHAYTVPPGPPDPVSAVYGIDIDGTFLESGREVLADAVNVLGYAYDDVVVHPVLEQGPASLVLTETSGTSRLLVLGPDDSTPWYLRLFESRVSRKLTQEARCPVIVVPDTWDSDHPGRGVTLLVDSQTVAHGPVRFAFEHASRHDEALSIIHFHVGEAPHDDAVPWQDMYRLIDSWRAMYPKVWARTKVVSAEPDLAAVESLERTGLLVMGRPHGQHLTSLLRRSLARAVIEHADCPVAVVPPDYEV